MIKNQRLIMKDQGPKTKDRRKIVQAVGLAVMIFFLSSVFSHWSVCAQDLSQKVDGFALEGFNKQGDRAWDVKGETADVLGDRIKISNVDANAYGEQEVNLKAKRGELDKKSGNVHLQDDVVVTTKEGHQLKTDSLDWEKANNLVTTDAEAVITNETMKAKGMGFKASPEMKKAQLERNVTVEAKSEKESEGQLEMVITCDGPMELDQLNNVATMKENVVAVRGDQVLRAELVEVHFDPKTKKIVTIVCTDDVSVQRGDNISYADKAIYSAADQKVIFVGRPKLIMTTDDDNDSFF